jgi:predicted HD phosphohydrolase
VFPHTLAWRGDRLYEARSLSEGLAAYDISDAGHPVEKAALAWRRTGSDVPEAEPQT